MECVSFVNDVEGNCIQWLTAFIRSNQQFTQETTSTSIFATELYLLILILQRKNTHNGQRIIVQSTISDGIDV